jgi:hypothetical protein
MANNSAKHYPLPDLSRHGFGAAASFIPPRFGFAKKPAFYNETFPEEWFWRIIARQVNKGPSK